MSASFFAFPHSLKSPLDAGLRLLDAGEAGEAAAVMEEALGKHPENGWLRLYLSLALVEDGRKEEGLAGIQRVVDDGTQNPLLRIFLGRALYDCGEYQRSAAECRRLLDAQPGHTGAVMLLQLCACASDSVSALRSLASMQFPDDAHLRGRALLAAESILVPRDAPALSEPWPHDVRPWDAPTTSLPQYDVAAPVNRKWADSLVWSGSPERELVMVEARMRESPTDALRVQLAQLYMDAGRCREVEAALQDFLLDDRERNTFVGTAQYYRGDFHGALETLQRAELGSAKVHHIMGRCSLAIGDRTAARRSFIRAAKHDSAIPEERVARAYLLCRANALTAGILAGSVAEQDTVLQPEEES